MIEVVPAILTDDPKVFLESAKRLIDAGVRRVHLDIGDGSFISTKTISGFEELMEHDLPLDWDVHLMVDNPQEHLKGWEDVSRADRFIVHVETTDDTSVMAKDVHERGKTFGVAIHPHTDLTVLDGVISDVDLVQFMTVIPGKQGGEFLPWVLDHVKKVRQSHPDLVIMVDGGVTSDTAQACVSAGANILVSGSYIMQSDDIARAVEELRKA